MVPILIIRINRERYFGIVANVVGLLTVLADNDINGHAIVRIADSSRLRVSIRPNGGQRKIVFFIDDFEYEPFSFLVHSYTPFHFNTGGKRSCNRLTPLFKQVSLLRENLCTFLANFILAVETPILQAYRVCALPNYPRHL